MLRSPLLTEHDPVFLLRLRIVEMEHFAAITLRMTRERIELTLTLLENLWPRVRIKLMLCQVSKNRIISGPSTNCLVAVVLLVFSI